MCLGAWGWCLHEGFFCKQAAAAQVELACGEHGYGFDGYQVFGCPEVGVVVAAELGADVGEYFFLL